MNREQQKKSTRKRLMGPAILGLGTALTLTGCSAGQISQTANQVSTVNGAHNPSGQGPVAVRNAQLVFPPNGVYEHGEDAPIKGMFINKSSQADKLVSVSSPAATSGQVSGTTSMPGRTALEASAQGSQAPGGKQSSPGHAPGKHQPNRAQHRIPQVQVKLTGITTRFGPGQTIPVTFNFTSGPVTLQVPVGADPQPRPDTGKLKKEPEIEKK